MLSVYGMTYNSKNALMGALIEQELHAVQVELLPVRINPHLVQRARDYPT
jgi:hypothetical protein